MPPKVVLVTGCSEGGIGFHLAEEFASQGCKVYATARKLEKMQNLQRFQIELLSLDVTDDSAVKSVVNTIIANEGKIDIVVNNAGVGCYGPTLELPLEQIQSAFDANVFSVLRVNRAVLPHMAARKQGMFITIGSISAWWPLPWGGIYSATKSAVHAITNALEMECRPFNIKVMLVAPGGVKSNIAANQYYDPPPDTLYSKYAERILGRRNLSQSSPMPTDVFSKQVVTKALLPNPPSYLTLGKSSTLFGFLRGFPVIGYCPYFGSGLVMFHRLGRGPSPLGSEQEVGSLSLLCDGERSQDYLRVSGS
ncbi:oxidoreductase [Russula compacta]|nr:oxidoreductase [Russula compacta]